jgi:glycoside/pentoside/hexuronide:cation symporter, GPH family
LDTSEKSIEREKLNFTTKLAYGAGDLGPAIAANLLTFFLLYFFTRVAGLPAGLSGSILAIGKISDAINDPITGILSDRTRSRWGRRMPWILYGAIPFGILLFLQWIVPQFSNDSTIQTWSLFTYYVAIGILSNLAYTAVNLPYTALTPELTQDYDERTSLTSFRFAFSIGGSILSLILARFIFQTYADDPQQQYLILGIISSIIATIALLWCAIRIQERGALPIINQLSKKILGFSLGIIGTVILVYGITQFTNASGNSSYGVTGILLGIEILAFGLTLIFAKTEPHLNNSAAVAARDIANSVPNAPIKEQIKMAFSNKPFLYVIGIYLCSWLAFQLTASILVYYSVSWMGMNEADSPTVPLAVQATAFIMLFGWTFISRKLDKKTVFILGSIIWIVAQGGLFLIQPGQIKELYFLAILAGFGVSVAFLIPWSMIPDVVDLDELNTNERREGIFYSFMVLLQKFGLALALFLVGQALEWSGFISQPLGGAVPVQPDSALLAIRIAVAPLPTIFLIIGVVLTYFYPITKEVHADIRRQLQERKDREILGN